MRGVPGLLGEMGIPAAPLLRRSGFREDPQDWDDLVVSQNQALHLLELSSEAAGDDHFAARIGGRIFVNLGAVALALAHAHNLTAAVRGANRALKLWREGVEFGIYVKGGYGVIAQHLHDVTNTQADVLGELALAAVCGIVRARIDPSWTPIAVVLPMSRSPFHHGLEDIFAAPVFYRAGPPRVVVQAPLLSQPFRRAMDAAGLAPLPPVALMRNDDMLVEQTQMVVDGMLALGDLSLEGAAQTLGLPVRTLQAQLGAMGSSFSHLVEERRRALAAQHLNDGRLRVAEIAMLLGYNDASNFTRAFRRWHDGLSPSDFRREALRSA